MSLAEEMTPDYLETEAQSIILDTAKEHIPKSLTLALKKRIRYFMNSFHFQGARNQSVDVYVQTSLNGPGRDMSGLVTDFIIAKDLTNVLSLYSMSTSVFDKDVEIESKLKTSWIKL